MRMRSIAVEALLAASGNCSMIDCISPRSEYVPSPNPPIILAMTMTVPARRGTRSLRAMRQRVQRVRSDDAEQ